MYHYTLTHINTYTLTVIFKVNLQNVDIDEILRPKFLLYRTCTGSACSIHTLDEPSQKVVSLPGQ